MPNDTVTLEDGRVIELTPEYLDRLRARGWLVADDRVAEAVKIFHDEDCDDLLPEPDDERERLEGEIDDIEQDQAYDRIRLNDLLQEIRDLRGQIRETNARLDGLKARLAALPKGE